MHRQRMSEEDPCPYTTAQPATGHCFNKRQDFPLRRPTLEGCRDCHLQATWAGVSVQSRGIMLTARSLQVSTASITPPKAESRQPSFQQPCPWTATFQLETACQIRTKHNDVGMVCKLHLPQRSQSAHKHISSSKGAKVLLKTPVCHQVVDSSSLAPCLKTAHSTAGVCKRKWEISFLHIWLLQNTLLQG